MWQMALTLTMGHN